jgi:hypothetical protein
MPLRDALSLSNNRSDDRAPITAELINNITNILAASKPDPDTYDIGAVFTGIVYAMRRIELNIVQTKEVLATLMSRDWGKSVDDA